MKIKVTPILTQTERAILVDLESRLRNICITMTCSNACAKCDCCPFDAITDHANDLADEICDKLRECKTEGEGE